MRTPLAGINISSGSGLNSSISYKPLISLPHVGYGASLGGGGFSSGASPSNNASLLNGSESSIGRSWSFFAQENTPALEGNSFVSQTSVPHRRIKALDMSVVLREKEMRAERLRQQHELEQSGVRHENPDSTTCDELYSPMTARQEESIAVPRMHLGSPIAVPASKAKAAAHREEYYYKPSLDELRKLVRDGVCHVDAGLTIGRYGYGSVFWRGPFELSELEGLDGVVHFRNREIIVYPDESKKPPIGEELNRPAEISLERVWPMSKQGALIKDPEELAKMQFRAKLESLGEKQGVSFIDYQPSTGTWAFTVSHF